MTNIPIPHHCPSCYTTLACEQREVMTYLPGQTSTQMVAWCPAVGCGQYRRIVTPAEYVHMPERDQNMLQWLLDRTESQRGW